MVEDCRVCMHFNFTRDGGDVERFVCRRGHFDFTDYNDLHAMVGDKSKYDGTSRACEEKDFVINASSRWYHTPKRS